MKLRAKGNLRLFFDNQFFCFRSTVLDPILQLQRIRLLPHLLLPYTLRWSAHGYDVLRPFTGIVLGDSASNIGGDAAIERIVFATE